MDDDRPESIGMEERESVRRYYERLTPEERRERILLVPAYRDAYNELVQAHRTIDQPAYFWDRWVPLLGPVASVLYMKLRQLCFSRPHAPAGDELCWPRQDALAREIGIRSRLSIRNAIELLERHGFIQREASHRVHERSGRPVRGADRYLVFFEIPLRSEDAAELLIRSAYQLPIELYSEKDRIDPIGSRSQKDQIGPLRDTDGSKRTESVLFGGEKDQIGPYGAGTNRSFTGVEKDQIVPATLSTLRSQRSTLSRHESILFDDSPARWLAEEIAEELDDPDSLKWFRLVADKLPEGRIRIVLSETRSARDEGRLRGSPGAYFTGAIRRVALELGIAL